MTNLLHQRCLAHPVEAMSESTIKSHLAQVSGWTVHDGAIQKNFAFQNFYETVAFINALAWICNTEDHHPELQVSFDRCVVRFHTHAIKGISVNDFICAAKADALINFVA